jgi:hypothetical protein
LRFRGSGRVYGLRFRVSWELRLCMISVYHLCHLSSLGVELSEVLGFRVEGLLLRVEDRFLYPNCYTVKRATLYLPLGYPDNNKE